MIESTLKPESAVYRETISAGDGWIHEIRAGQTFRIVDLKGNQAVDTLFYSARDTEERYSAQDTIVGLQIARPALRLIAAMGTRGIDQGLECIRLLDQARFGLLGG